MSKVKAPAEPIPLEATVKNVFWLLPVSGGGQQFWVCSILQASASVVTWPPTLLSLSHLCTSPSKDTLDLSPACLISFQEHGFQGLKWGSKFWRTTMQGTAPSTATRCTQGTVWGQTAWIRVTTAFLPICVTICHVPNSVCPASPSLSGTVITEHPLEARHGVKWFKCITFFLL